MDQDERERLFGHLKTKDYWDVRSARTSRQNTLIKYALELTPQQRERLVAGIEYATAVIEAHPKHRN